VRASRFFVRGAGVALLTAGLGIGGFSDVAIAHTRTVEPSCTGLSFTLEIYDGPAENNKVTVTIDGVSTTYFFEGFYKKIDWSPTEVHTWSVVVDANLLSGDPDMWDWSASGTQQACTTPDTTTTVPDTTTTVPETTTTTTTMPETTTTVPQTTTTVPETTTTVPDTTTSTVPDTTTSTVPDTTTSTVPVTTTSTVPDTTSSTQPETTTSTTAPTTSTTAVLVTVVTQPSTTTTAVQVLPPGATSPTTTDPAVPAETPELPVTGGSTTPLVLAGGTLLGLGAVLAAVRRRGQITG
jgi:LPXTG-motif cell wall-anchored protein